MSTTSPITTPAATGGTPPVVVSLFGSFGILVNGQPIAPFRSSKVRALFAYLLLASHQPLLRTTLIDLLWSDYTAESAQTSLRQALANLRSSLKPFALLNADRHYVQLTVEPTVVWCDVLHFEELLAACQRHPHQTLHHCPACRERLRQALALYTGPFLNNLPALDSAPFTAWLHTQQARLAERVAAVQTLLAESRTLPGNLPRPLTSLIGRTTELSELADKALHPIYRCLTLLGPGGIGKTRLAIALGEQLRANFVDGIWFVALAALAAENQEMGEQANLNDRIATAISQAMGVSLQGSVRPAEQVTESLRTKSLLLILDNFEHLSPGVDWLVTLLQEAPHVRLVVTSRHRLPLQAQLVYPITGLALPPEKAEEALAPAQLIAHYASVQLFVERAETVAFPLLRDSPNLAAISALCRVLEGAPLGIELAVALLETQTPNEILQMVRTHYAALQANLGDLPLRHRSAYAVLHTAWDLLTAQEAQTLARCAVFRGGFTLPAAQQIIYATVTDLESLVNKSLLHRAEPTLGADGGTVRYMLHELVRQFAAEQLAQQAAQFVHDSHASYYLALLERWQPSADAERAFRQTIQLDLANVEAAWAWALAGDLVMRLPHAVNGLAEFYDLVNAPHAAEASLQQSIAQVRIRLAATPINSTLHTGLRHLLTRLLGRLAYVYAQSLGQSQQAQPAAEEALALAQSLGDAALLTYSYFVLQLAAYSAYDFVQGQRLAQKALALAQEYGLVREQALALVGIGLNATLVNDLVPALNALTQAVALAQQIQDARLEQMVRTSLGVTYRMMGDFAQATHCFEENLPLLRQNDNQYQIAGVLVNLGILRLLLGDYARAGAYIEDGYGMLTALGEKRLAAECLFALGWNCIQKGENASALTYCQQALTVVVSDASQQMVWLTMGDAYLNLGELEAAERAYTQVIALGAGGGSVTECWHAQAGLAAILLARHDRVAALAAVDALLLAFDPTQPDGWQCPQRLLLICYRILAANADPRAAAVLHQGWQLVQSQAEKISDPALRTSFFTKVPVNQALGTLIAA